jgi:hypothetical protein
VSYLAPCPCGGSVRVESKSDLRICSTCDYVNRRFVLHLAMSIHDSDLGTSELLVRMTSFETELDGNRGAEARKRRSAEAGN